MARKETGIVVVSAVCSGSTVNLPLPSTNTVWTDSIKIDDTYSRNIGAACILNGVLDSANAIVTAEQSFESPAVEGSAHASYVAVQTVNITAVGTWNYVALMSGAIHAIWPYIRFKVASVTTNTSSTVNIKVSRQVSG